MVSRSGPGSGVSGAGSDGEDESAPLPAAASADASAVWARGGLGAEERPDGEITDECRGRERGGECACGCATRTFGVHGHEDLLERGVLAAGEVGSGKQAPGTDAIARGVRIR